MERRDVGTPSSTLIFITVLAASLAAGVIIGLAVSRWPALGAPHLSPARVAGPVAAHPRVAGQLRADEEPRRTTGLALTTAAVTLAVGAFGVGVLLLMVRTDTGFARFDLRFAQFGADHATAATTSFLRSISLLGGTAGIVLAAVIVGAVESLRSRSAAVIAFLTIVVGGQFAISNLVKWLVDRARPTIDQLTGFAGSSFPSGHSTAAAATFAAFALLLGRGRAESTKVVLAGAAAATAAAVATSRVLLGVHWFTDVLAGLTIGWTWFAICSIAFGGRWLHFAAPVEAAEQAARAATATPT